MSGICNDLPRGPMQERTWREGMKGMANGTNELIIPKSEEKYRWKKVNLPVSMVVVGIYTGEK